MSPLRFCLIVPLLGPLVVVGDSSCNYDDDDGYCHRHDDDDFLHCTTMTTTIATVTVWRWPTAG